MYFMELFPPSVWGCIIQHSQEVNDLETKRADRLFRVPFGNVSLPYSWRNKALSVKQFSGSRRRIFLAATSLGISRIRFDEITTKICFNGEQDPTLFVRERDPYHPI